MQFEEKNKNKSKSNNNIKKNRNNKNSFLNQICLKSKTKIKTVLAISHMRSKLFKKIKAKTKKSETKTHHQRKPK